MQIANKHIQSYTTCVFFREMKIKQVTTAHVLEWLISPKHWQYQLLVKRQNNRWGIVGGNAKWYSHVGREFDSFL